MHLIQLPKILSPQEIPIEFSKSPADYISSLFQNGGDGTRILLSQGSVWELETNIKITANRAELATQGYPADSSLYAQLHVIGESEATAISFHNTHHVKLSHLTIDGRRPDKGWIEGGGALVACGGRQCKDPVVQHCILRHPRGWSCLHLFDECQGGRVIGNKVGPAGLPAPDGPWADGLSIACRNGLIANNEITDATDGAIVLFCAPGTLCIGNTIIADKHALLGGINMVDFGPYEGDYSNTKVIGNVIRSNGAFIKLGIGIGPLAWCPSWAEKNRGGKVYDNLFGPGRFGYGIGLSGCKEFKVFGNRIVDGTTFSGDLSHAPEPLSAPPVAFLKASQPGLVEECLLQSEFIHGHALWLIGVEDRPARKLRYHASHLNLSSNGPPLVLDRVKITLEISGELRVTCNSSSQLLWTSGSYGSSVGAQLTLEPNGHLTIRELGSGRLLWDPLDCLSGHFELVGEGALTVSDQSPFFILWTEDNSIIWASEYVFEKGSLELRPNQFICVPPTATWSQPQPPPIPPRIGTSDQNIHPPPPVPLGRPLVPALFIFLDPQTSNLVIHFSPHPRRPHGHVIWASDLFDKYPKQVPNREGDGLETRCAFQGGDGNLVIYANPFDDKPESRCAIWASGTNCQRLKILNEIRGEMGLKFINENGEIIKSIP
ncbi:hypothetical protein O181_005433 [Austropuccinia psidii MF-1]|uniref:Bulb-type lectin domain-containing protein n=1 Tax=Austropuccinia psidii MF-1 TaxID=1389203 RepID=A0A9Q3BII1_9BASI|nr:hypothetical protein [Austropuccinia psidii MF-1]